MAPTLGKISTRALIDLLVEAVMALGARVTRIWWISLLDSVSAL